MTHPTNIPTGFELARTTPKFTHATVPAALLSAHRLASDVWGRLRVVSGELRFEFEDDPLGGVNVATDGEVTIPPGVAHHIVLGPNVRFVIEFYRASGAGESSVS